MPTSQSAWSPGDAPAIKSLSYTARTLLHMLRLLVDTPTWLDLAKRRDGERWIAVLGLLSHQEKLELLVPTLVARRIRRQSSSYSGFPVPATVSELFRLIKKTVDDYGLDDRAFALEVLEGLAVQVPIIGAMATRNLDEIAEPLFATGVRLEVTQAHERQVVERARAKRAPFHRGRNSQASAVLMELYAREVAASDLDQYPHTFL